MVIAVLLCCKQAQQITHVLHNFGPYEVAKMRTYRVQVSPISLIDVCSYKEVGYNRAVLS